MWTSFSVLSSRYYQYIIKAKIIKIVQFTNFSNPADHSLKRWGGCWTFFSLLEIKNFWPPPPIPTLIFRNYLENIWSFFIRKDFMDVWGGLINSLTALGVVFKWLFSCFTKHFKTIKHLIDIRSFFFLSGFSFWNIHNSAEEQQRNEEAISLTPLYHFYLVYRPLDINQVFTADNSPLHKASSWAQIVNLWFPGASC